MMKIYVCVDKIIVNNLEFISALQYQLKKYYQQPIDVECYLLPSPNTGVVYIMDKATYSGFDQKIIESIKTVIGKYLGISDVNVKLNYSSFNPYFKPQVASKTQEVKQDALPKAKSEPQEGTGEYNYEKLSENYCSVEPLFNFEQVILSEDTKNRIIETISIIDVENKVFDEWGLRSIIPTATSAMSFYGPPGTGKTMAAEAVASRMGKKLLSATYADIESKYHGEGPKMVKAIFRAAERDDAVLFLDESDSLLSKRLTNVSDGSSQAINSMRSQLLISLERFKGVVIFATNLVVNYDKAFLSRLINIEFKLPDKELREQIWWCHLKSNTIRIPLSDDVNVLQLAELYEFCGREIKNSVKTACVTTALNNRDKVSQQDFINACEKIKAEAEQVILASDHTEAQKSSLTAEQNNILKTVIQNKINNE